MRRALVGPAVIAGSLAIALVLILLSLPPSSAGDDPSSRAAGRAGTLALYDWLDRLGFRVHRITGQLETGSSDVIVIADPRTTVTDAQADSVMRALAGGADLVLAVSETDPGAAAALLDRLRVAVDGGREAGDSTPAQPIDAGDRVHHVPMAAGLSIEAAPHLTPLLAQAGALTAVAETVPGGGRAYVLASPFALSNDGLRDGDSATLVLSLLDRARGGAIGFDEVHHGEAQAVLDGPVAIFESPLGLALAMTVVALVAFLALSGRRLGPALPTRDAAQVPSTGTYIDALAGLYGRSAERGAVAAGYAQELRGRLGGSLGTPSDSGDAALVAGVARVRPELAAAVEGALARAAVLAAARPGAGELLELAREVDDLERRWTEPVGAGPAQ